MVMAPQELNSRSSGYPRTVHSYSDLDTTSPTGSVSGIFGYQDHQGPGQRSICCAREHIVSLIFVILPVQIDLKHFFRK